MSNCSYRLKIHPVKSSRHGLAKHIFLYAKNIQYLGEIGWPARVFISMTLLPAMNASGAGSHGWAPTNSANLHGGGDADVCVYVCVCAPAWVCARVCACARA